MLIRKSVFDAIGGFDERIFMYAEEVEFTYRMKKMTDYVATVVPSVKLIHLDGASSAKNKTDNLNIKRLELMLTGNATYFNICFGKSEEIRYLDYMIKISKKKKKLWFFSKNKKRYYDKYIDVIRGVKDSICL